MGLSCSGSAANHAERRTQGHGGGNTLPVSLRCVACGKKFIEGARNLGGVACNRRGLRPMQQGRFHFALMPPVAAQPTAIALNDDRQGTGCLADKSGLRPSARTQLRMQRRILAIRPVIKQLRFEAAVTLAHGPTVEPGQMQGRRAAGRPDHAQGLHERDVQRAEAAFAHAVKRAHERSPSNHASSASISSAGGQSWWMPALSPSRMPRTKRYKAPPMWRW
jgi:hypothetical protein